jgi:transposase
MLGQWRSHEEYRNFVLGRINNCREGPLTPAHSLFPIIAKLFFFDLDPLKEILAGRYSRTGRPAVNQPEIMRIMILMQYLKTPVCEWIRTLKENFMLRTACGLMKKNIPNISSLYAFIYRLTRMEKRLMVRSFKRKPKFKLKNGEKLPPKHPNITRRIADKLSIGRRFRDTLAESINSILALAVKQSYANCLIGPHVNISGDGTCMETGASPYGKKICGCNCNGTYNCDCPRRFSDPNANWGWDSHDERPFYGYTGYFLSTYDKLHKIDLPLYLRIVDARRHDSVSALVALAEFRDRYIQLHINIFISDNVSDNQATYDLLEEWFIDAVIALGKPIKRWHNAPP